jgi:hypothetical protein
MRSITATLGARSPRNQLRQVSHLNSALIYSVIVGFVGAALFLFVDKYERDGTMANLMKLLVLVVGGAAILHKLLPLFDIELF